MPIKYANSRHPCRHCVSSLTKRRRRFHPEVYYVFLFLLKYALLFLTSKVLKCDFAPVNTLLLLLDARICSTPVEIRELLMLITPGLSPQGPSLQCHITMRKCLPVSNTMHCTPDSVFPINFGDEHNSNCDTRFGQFATLVLHNITFSILGHTR